MMNKMKIFSLLCVATLSLAACGGAKEKLGLTKKSPDEFAVVKRAPLSMPPDYSLRPPQPGAPRPQEQSAQAEARETVFGQNGQPQAYAQPVGGDDAAFLNRTGANKADPTVRQKIDAETAILNEKEKPVIKRVMGIDSPEQAPASVVNPKAESERLQKNKEQGKPVTEGKTPSVEQD